MISVPCGFAAGPLCLPPLNSKLKTPTSKLKTLNSKLKTLNSKLSPPMNRLRQAWVWLTRLSHCRGFGIHSPNDYRFERCVINESSPYYAYDELGSQDSSLRKKLGRLYLRLANELQPATVIDHVRVADYILAGCRRANITDQYTQFDLAVVPIQTEFQQIFDHCQEHSVVVFENIWQQPALWHCIEYHPKAIVTFDLYYCGIVFFDKKRSPQNYIVCF